MQSPRIILILMAILPGGVLFLALAQDDPFEAMEKRFEEMANKQEEAFDQTAAEMEFAWDQMEKEQEEAWDKMVEQVENMWRDRVVPTDKVWVDYTPEYDRRSRVDFEEGQIQVEVLVPVDVEDPRRTGQEMIAEQFAQTYREEDPETGESILADQIETTGGLSLNEQILAHFIQEEVVPKAEVAPEIVLSGDGTRRFKVQATVSLVPEHLRVRAAHYRKEVIKNAEEMGVLPELVFAIIHTESAFNPKAHSGAGAYGLMQLIPRYGARDAYRFLHDKDAVIKPDSLYDPATNIRLGTAYVHLLANRYMKDIEDPTKKEYLVVCGYNWGPPAVRKALRDHPVDRMSSDQLYQVLQKSVPKETGNYLERVTARKPMYLPMVIEP
ncbi:DUF3393 domain-containing protein [bacterium]|nr:DUF3393 domain-containing protein [bacterium]